MALFGVIAARGNTAHIITAKTEHSSILEPCSKLEEAGMRVTYLPVDANGIVDLEALRQAVSPDTVLISIAYANNETGVIQPIREIAEIARRSNVLFHTDAVQAAGKIPLDVNCDGADLLSLSAHKFYGLKGTGALYVRKGVTVSPILHGGGQESGLRSGTENTVGIVAMGEAATLALNDLEETARRIETLRDLRRTRCLPRQGGYLRFDGQCLRFRGAGALARSARHGVDRRRGEKLRAVLSWAGDLGRRR
jgi:cysteine desulfurase